MINEEIMVGKVVCNDCFCITDYERNIRIRKVDVPAGSIVCGTTEVTVTECEPVIDRECDAIWAKITLYLHKELTIRTPDCREIRLEYGFRIPHCGRFCDCSPCKLYHCASCLLNGLQCRVTDIRTEDILTLHPSTNGSDAYFDDALKVELDVSLLTQQSLVIPFC